MTTLPAGTGVGVGLGLGVVNQDFRRQGGKRGGSAYSCMHERLSTKVVMVEARRTELLKKRPSGLWLGERVSVRLLMIRL